MWQSIVALCSYAAIAPASAQPGLVGSITARDVQVLLRTIPFFSPPHVPVSCIAVVFAVGDPNSRRDAQIVAGLFATAGGIQRALAVPSDGLAQASDCALIVAASGAPVDAVMDAARQQHVPCVTASLSFVEAGRCTMWVRSEPRVEIVVNHDALVSGGMSLASAFRMMIREL